MKIGFSNIVVHIAQYARDEAMRTGWYGIGPDHLTLAILRQADNRACEALEALGLDPGALKKFIDGRIFREEAVPYNRMDEVKATKALRSVMNMAAFEALRLNLEEVCPEHLLLALSRTSGNATADCFRLKGITPETLYGFFGAHTRDTAAQTPPPRLEDIAGALGEQISNLYGATCHKTNIYS